MDERNFSFTPILPCTLSDILGGLAFSLPFLAVLTVHEFGHYFTARLNKVKVTLPYYIPLWLGPFTTIGTMEHLSSSVAGS
ncbi:site-2 protease family protein, partial [Siphonobacter sp. BAB-5405]|uniref:site-2 protease family protein n=1 Tax=Siphonobacter sp. BAB-5405 TaxID=1864825 RepID=UPI003515A73A